MDQFDFSRLTGPLPDDPAADAIRRLMGDQMSGQAVPRADTFFDLLPSPPFRFRRDIEFPLYRYTQRIFAEEFLRSGRLRLNTLLNYTEQELFNAAIGDDREGRVMFRRAWYDPVDNDDHVVEVNVVVQNQWTLCASETRDDARMMAAFEADCCYMINSLDFFEAVNETLGERSASGVLDRVVYLEEGINHIDLDAIQPGQPRFAGFYKQNRYAYQNEVRAVWETPKVPMLYDFRPSAEDIEPALVEHVRREKQRMSPLMIEAPRAAQYCTLLD